jgi:hypothetical protein
MKSDALPTRQSAPPIAEEQRLAAAHARSANWQRWGTYLAERQWGTVREDQTGYNMGDNETWCTSFNNDNYLKTGRLEGDEIIEVAPRQHHHRCRARRSLRRRPPRRLEHVHVRWQRANDFVRSRLAHTSRRRQSHGQQSLRPTATFTTAIRTAHSISWHEALRCFT